MIFTRRISATTSTSLDLNSGELRLIEVKGIGAVTGTVLLTPNERRVAEDRRDCYWLYVVTSCKSQACFFRNRSKTPPAFRGMKSKKLTITGWTFAL